MPKIKIKELPFEFYKIYKIYEFYDGPIIYSFIDTNGKYYLVNWIDWIEETDENVWMYLSVNKEDLSQLENKAYSLREFLDKNLSKNVYVAIEDGEKEEFFLTKIKEFKDSWLPAADYYIEDEEVEE